MGVRATLRSYRDSAAAAWQQKLPALGVTARTFAVVGYVRDAVVIVGIVAGGTYLLSSPDKVDALLNWMLGRA